MDQNIGKDLLDKFFNKTCSKDEEDKVFLWLSEKKQFELVESLMKEKWNESKVKSYNEADLDKIYSRILSSIQKKDSIEPQIVKRKSKQAKIHFMPVIKIAASLLLIFASIYAFMNLKDNKPLETVMQISEIVKSTSKGTKLTTRLPDGSMVNLNSDSEIRYPEIFSDSNRVVFLTGEAYFEVAKSIDKPFIVKTKTITTTALGTAFNVKADKASGKIIISLTEGKVKVSSDDGDYIAKNDFILDPGDELTYHTESRESKITKLNYKTSISWKDGFLIFEDEDIEGIKEKLEKWYGVNIIFLNKPHQKWKFTSEYKNQSLKDVLEGIQFAKNIEYEIDKKNVMILFK